MNNCMFTSTPIKPIYNSKNKFQTNLSRIRERENRFKLKHDANRVITFSTLNRRHEKKKTLIPSSTCREFKTNEAEQIKQPLTHPISENMNDPSTSNKLSPQKDVHINDFSKPSCSNIVKQTNETETDIPLKNVNSEPKSISHGENVLLPVAEPLRIQNEIKISNNNNEILSSNIKKNPAHNLTSEEEPNKKELENINGNQEKVSSTSKQKIMKPKPNKSIKKQEETSDKKKKKVKLPPLVKSIDKKLLGTTTKLMTYPPGASHSTMTPIPYTQVHFIHKGYVLVTIDCLEVTVFKEGEFLVIPEGSCYMIKNESPLMCQIATLC